MARNNEPAFRRKTPLLICSIRTEIPYPCIGSSANVFRMSISSVPWTRSLGLSGISLLPLGSQEEHTLLLLVVKRRRAQNSWSWLWQAGQFPEGKSWELYCNGSDCKQRLHSAVCQGGDRTQTQQSTIGGHKRQAKHFRCGGQKAVRRIRMLKR